MVHCGHKSWTFHWKYLRIWGLKACLGIRCNGGTRFYGLCFMIFLCDVTAIAFYDRILRRVLDTMYRALHCTFCQCTFVSYSMCLKGTKMALEFRDKRNALVSPTKTTRRSGGGCTVLYDRSKKPDIIEIHLTWLYLLRHFQSLWACQELRVHVQIQALLTSQLIRVEIACSFWWSFIYFKLRWMW